MLYLLAYILTPLLLGGFCLTLGYLIHKHTNMKMPQRQHMQQMLASWQINVDVSSSLIQNTKKHINTLRAFMLYGASIGLFLAAIVLECITLLTTGTLLLPGSWFSAEPFGEVLMPLMFAGFWLGQLVWFKKLKRASARHVAFGDLRRRLASDYRSPFLHSIPLILIIINTAITLSCLSIIPSPVRILVMNGTTVWWPSWTLLILPTTMLLLILGIEVGIGNVVRFPRLLVTNEPERAHHIDDMLRSLIIGSLIGNEYYLVGTLQWTQMRLLTTGLSVIPEARIPLYIPIWGLLSFFIWMALLTLGSCSWAWEGHIGGTISGWPRRRAIAGRSDGTAVADR